MDGKPLPAVVAGLGAGTIAGAYLGSISMWYGTALLAVGIGLYLAVPKQPTFILGKALDEPPGLEHLGTRVERILRLAEEQAEDHKAEAEREAARIVAEAEREAARIVAEARAQAAAIRDGSHTES
jgi:hypothetical protein